MPEDEQPASNQPPGWEYKPGGVVAEQSQETPQPTQPKAEDPDEITWTASEFIDHEKRSGWYLTLLAITLASVAVVYLITRDVITAVVLVIIAIIFGVQASRKPRILTYKISDAGLQIEKRNYPFAQFKSFSIIDEGALESITLHPLRRFMTPITIYYPPEQADDIVDAMNYFLPHEEKDLDAIDKLMRRLRF